MSVTEPTTLGIGVAAAGAIAFGLWYLRRRRGRRRAQKENRLQAQENI
ncbi:MAG: hypothetical protein M3114_04025 [Thermoproteota archaeon]|nr:hypothetical protein [Thermoproteota archaeon]MDQ4066733.1 hypothetical protein [Thermoproteota archaeon]